MDRFQNSVEENNDDNTNAHRRNHSKRKFHCRIPVPTRSTSISSASTAQEGHQSDVGSSCSGQPAPITIKIKLCTSRSTARPKVPPRNAQNKTSRRNEVEQQEFETWRQNRIQFRHSDDCFKIKESQLPYPTPIQIEQRPKSPSETIKTNTAMENQEQPARFVQTGPNSETVEASSTPQTLQMCQCSPGAPQFQQNAGQHFCRCKPPRTYDSGIVLYEVCGNNCRRMRLQEATSTNVEVIPAEPETVRTVVRDEITPRSRSVSKDKSSTAVSASEPTGISKFSKSVDTTPINRCSSVEQNNATDETYTIQGTTKLSEDTTAESSSSASYHRTESKERSKIRSIKKSAGSFNLSVRTTAESRSSSKNDSKHRTESKERTEFRSKYDSSVSAASLNRSRNKKKVLRTDLSTIKRSTNSGETGNWLPKYDNTRNHYSLASEELPKITLMNGSQCHESSTAYFEALSALRNGYIQDNDSETASFKASPYYYSVEVLNDARNQPATVIPSILSKTSKYDNAQPGNNLKTQYRQPLSSADLRSLPDNQVAGIYTCSGPLDTVIKMPSVSYIPISEERQRSDGSPLPEVVSRNFQELSICTEKKPKSSIGSQSYSEEILKPHSFQILPEDHEETVTEERSELYDALNSPNRNESSHANLSAPNPVINTTATGLPSNETTPTKLPDEFRLRGGQDVDFSLRKRYPSGSKNQATRKITIKTQNDFSLKFYNSGEETQCPCNEHTESSPEQVPNVNVTSEKEENKAGRSSVDLCRLKKHMNCTGSLTAMVSSSSSDADDVQWGPPYSSESPNHSGSAENHSKYSRPIEDATPPCMSCCTNQPNTTLTKANKVFRPRNCAKYRPDGRPATCKCYEVPTRDEFLAKTMETIYACRTDRRPKQFIYGRVTKAERKPTGMLRNSKTNLMRSSHSSDCASLPLNFRQICIYLKTARLERRAELLQAIRWRLTKESRDVQLKTITDICDYDLFKLRCRCGSRSLLEDLLWPLNTSVPNALQESTARLLNAIVSTQPGRNYVGGVSVIETLVWGETIYATPFSYNDRDYVNVQMADQLMATMMKLSLNPAQRTDMIHKGLVRWLIRHMEDVEYSATAYHQENMIALLMMLVGHPGSQEIVAEKCTQVLSLLIRYMQHPNEKPAQPFQRYIRLALIDLMHSARLVSCAKHINFPQIVSQMIKKCTDSVERNELETIAELLEKTNTSLLNSLPAYQIVFKENQIFREPNIDSNDPVAVTTREFGEKLLNAKFSQPTASPVSKTFQIDSCRTQATKASNTSAFSEQNQSFFPVPHRNRIFGGVHLPVQQKQSKPQQARSTTPLPDIANKNNRSKSRTSLRQRSASPKRTTSNLSDHPSISFTAEMVKTKCTITKPTIVQNEVQQTSTSAQSTIAVAKDQVRSFDTALKAKPLGLSPGHESLLEKTSLKSSLHRSASVTVQRNSSNLIQEKERAETLPRAKPSSKTTSRQKAKEAAQSSVNVLNKHEQNCEKCGFVKILYVVDRCTSMVDMTRARSASEQLANRLSETNQIKSNVGEVIKPNSLSETVQLAAKNLTEATQTEQLSYQLTDRNGCFETCGRPVQTPGYELRYQDHKPSKRYYETKTPALATKRCPNNSEKSSKYQQCGLCGRFNDEKCNFDCLARTFSDQQSGSCLRPIDRQMSAPLVSLKSSMMLDSAALPYQTTAKSLDIENYGRPMLGQFDKAEGSPIESSQKELIAQPNDRHRLENLYFEKEQKAQCYDDYQPIEQQNKKPPQLKRHSRSMAKSKCHKETCSQICRSCSRRNTEPKPTCQGLPMTAQQIRSKSKSPDREQPRYPPRSVFFVDNEEPSEYWLNHQYQRKGNDEEVKLNAATRFPFNSTSRKLPPQTFDRCCQSTKTPCSANEEPSQGQRRMSAPVQNNTPMSTQVLLRFDSVDSTNINVDKRPVGDIPDLATMQNGKYETTQTAKQNNNPPKDCKCCCCQRKL